MPVLRDLDKYHRMPNRIADQETRFVENDLVNFIDRMKADYYPELQAALY
jgi:hypothetical protein